VTDSVKQQPVLKKRQLTPKQRSNARISYGDAGEELATAFLKKSGYTILERNLRLKTYEVDIIALDARNHELVFLEVKRRRKANFGHPAHAVSYKKLHSMHQVANVYRATHSFPLDYRFDIIAIIGKKIEHIKNITWLT
jgi:putative endonuclease